MSISGIGGNYTSSAGMQSIRETQERIRKSLVSVTNDPSRLKKVSNLCLIASDKSYTKEDAIRYQWEKEGRFSLNDVMNGVKIKMQDPNPGAEVLQEFEKRLQTEGIQKEIDWSDLNFDLHGIGFNVGKPAYAISENELSRKTNYLASRYVAAEDKIRNSTTGDTQAEQLEKLNEIYRKALNEITESYLGTVGSYLENNGVNSERDKIRDSIVSGVESKIDEYRRALTGNATLESLKGTPDEWLLDDSAYVAAVLRGSVSGSAETARTKSGDVPYTIDDLDTLGQYVAALAKTEAPWNETNRTFCTDEARLGVEYAMLDMKTDKLCSSGRVSDAMSKLLQKTRDGFMRSCLERLDQELAKRKEKGGAIGDSKGFASLNRSVVWDVYRYTMQEYKNGRDMIQTLLSGIKYGSKKTAELLKTETYRARMTADFWANFFERDEHWWHESSDSSYQKYMAGLRDFEVSLSSGEAVRMNLELKESKYYAAGKTSIFDKTV